MMKTRRRTLSRWSLVALALAAVAALAIGVTTTFSLPDNTSSQAPPPTPEVTDALVAIAGVRDIPPAGAPAQLPPLPAFKRGFDTACGATAPAGNLTPKNLLRWSFDPELGFPDNGFDLYRCCNTQVAPPSSDDGWVLLNTGGRIRPPKTTAEGMAFVNGSGLMPDGTRQVKGPMLTPLEWTGVCRALANLNGQPTYPSCGPDTSDPNALFTVTQDDLSFLLLTSLRPEYAAMLGLYWVDGEAPDGDCFYRVQGHWATGVHEGVTGPLRQTPVTPPTGLTAAQMPGVGSDDCMQLGGPAAAAQPGALSAGLSWDMPEDNSAISAAELPVTFNVCRDGPAETTLIQINDYVYDDGGQQHTGERPVIVGQQPRYDSQGGMVMTATGEPEYAYPASFYRDALGEGADVTGAYTYRVTGLDIFGRESLPSAPANLTIVDAFAPPAPANLRAETSQPPTQTHADITLTFEWTNLEMTLAPDAASFKIYRRAHTPERGHQCACGLVGGVCPEICRCPLPLDQDPDWQEVHTVAIDAYSRRFDTQNPLPPHPTDPTATSADEAMLGASLPVQRYVFVDTPVTLTATDPPVVNYYYRVVALDGESTPNVGEPSGPARGHVVDNTPATPPDAVTPYYSRSEWSGMVDVHLLWEGDTSGTDPMGYKLLRSARAPRCQTQDECPKDCDQTSGGDVVCEVIPCQGGFCGGPDAGPTGPRQLDREASLTNGVIAYNPAATLRELGKLTALATLGNLFTRDPATGAPIPVTAADLQNIDPTLTQYGQSSIPAKAASQVFFFRVMAVSRAGMQESEPGQPSSINLNPFVVQVPDFIAPSTPQLLSALARPQEGAVELRWAVGPERDAHRAPGGYTLHRADLGDRPCAPTEAICCLTDGHLPLEPDDFTWMSPEACVEASPSAMIVAPPETRQDIDVNTGEVSVFVTSNHGVDVLVTQGVSLGRCQGDVTQGCAKSSDCGGNGPCLTGRCDGSTDVCLLDGDCGANGPCVTGTCRDAAQSSCQTDGDCAGTGATGTCSQDPGWPCTTDAECGASNTCKHQCLPGTCELQRGIGCATDSDCPPLAGGGVEACIIGAAATPVCEGKPSVSCTSDTDCLVATDVTSEHVDETTGVVTTLTTTVDVDQSPCVNRRRPTLVFSETGHAAYCGDYLPICCEVPGNTPTVVDNTWCTGLGGTTYTPELIGNSGSYTPAGLVTGLAYHIRIYRFPSGRASGAPLASATMVSDDPQTLTWDAGTCRLDAKPCSADTDCGAPTSGYCDGDSSTCEGDGTTPCTSHTDCAVPTTGTCEIPTGQPSGHCDTDGQLTCTSDAACPAPAHQRCEVDGTPLVVERRSGPFLPIHTTPLLPADQAQAVDGVQVFTDGRGTGVEVMRAWDDTLVPERDYVYALTLVDSAGNVSPRSGPLVGRAVDVIKPVGPQSLSAAHGSLQGVVIEWEHPEPGLVARVKRSTVGASGPWHVLERRARPLPLGDDTVVGPESRPYTTWPSGAAGDWGYRYVDTDAHTAKDLWYRIEVYDSAGNKSPRNDGIAYVGGVP